MNFLYGKIPVNPLVVKLSPPPAQYWTTGTEIWIDGTDPWVDNEAILGE